MHRIGLVLASKKEAGCSGYSLASCDLPAAACHPIVVLGHSLYVVIAVCDPA